MILWLWLWSRLIKISLFVSISNCLLLPYLAERFITGSNPATGFKLIQAPVSTKGPHVVYSNIFDSSTSHPTLPSPVTVGSKVVASGVTSVRGQATRVTEGSQGRVTLELPTATIQVPSSVVANLLSFAGQLTVTSPAAAGVSGLGVCVGGTNQSIVSVTTGNCSSGAAITSTLQGRLSALCPCMSEHCWTLSLI